ncbi:hypothetical protein [Nitrososphaera sp.]|uniref:hypothetical protein n=1 Tax=Nitrososphaera sp. TaxID=1971748 RepID=UPI00184D53B4|nr:hypothetical protein [Nitrososphaera sp.]NWG36804.1 hypothetical protein [Nitrososphaera sp.]
MSAFDENPYSVHFAHFAAKLEQHLRKNGVSCDDADRIIEESSALYFEKLGPSNKLFKFLKKSDPERVFVDSARRAIAARLPEAVSTFGSQVELTKAVH